MNKDHLKKREEAARLVAKREARPVEAPSKPSNKATGDNAKIEREVSGFGDVSGYRGSRYASPSTQSHFDKIPNVPVVIPSRPSAGSPIIPRYMIEGGARSSSQSDSDFNNEIHYSDGTTTIDIDGSGIVITRAGKSLTINPALITQNMGIVEIDVCSGGVAKKMLIIGSAPY